ncbi:phospholipase D [Cryptococcus wingfieldii CBS 7118]|uniref:Phospholipase n=1 Tax=Cryptococcus wingfieldii CBS 7118 TaxID=1295528 RepID=A0A1E3JIL7_9TREE|nr:phospholipase D [Cryptococcus wingfieldii CBS 7118]ODO00720.1 phospholipase D [Cryptococcus wingfieldii CBS 7118]
MALPQADAHGTVPPKSKNPLHKIRNKVDNLASNVSRLGITVSTTWNPNHRHDEDWEKEVDAKMEAIRDSHRFRSFAGERSDNLVKWHVDGHDYFWALSEAIDGAKESIMILDWWLSPELQLRRPAAKFPEWRLDRLLKKKAEQGVRVYVQVYKEVDVSMTLSSKHTKHALEDMHENITVVRHPDHSSNEIVLYFSHHEKLCIVDSTIALMGGLDACFGRWDTHNHPLADVHPTEFWRTLFPGQDYNNNRVMDFQTVDKFVSNALAVQETPRMPWHDVSLSMIGPSVVDLVQHFCERWNFVKKFKYMHNHKIEWLSLPHPWENISSRENQETTEAENEFRLNHPHLAEWKEAGRQFFHPYHFPPSDLPRADEAVPHGTSRVQVLRSAADWSHGILREDSIQQAYIGLIAEANHCIYIENQFFVTTCKDGQPVENLIGLALARRIISAAKDGKKFKAHILIPAVPCFPGDISTESGIKAIMEAQYRSINRGGASIFEMVREAGYDPEEYISFWNLRSYDRINYPYARIKRMEERSGVTFQEAQVALAKIYVGGADVKGDVDEVVNIEQPHDQTTGAEDIGKKETQKAVKLPKTVEEARAIIEKFQAAAANDDKHVSDNVCQHALQDKTTLNDEQWDGSEEEELSCFVSELLYIHSKLMIVDDRRVICGSANINDRSMKGDHDSEIAIVIEDSTMVESLMDGKKYMASAYATTLRRSLMREHLGLLPHQEAFDDETQPTASMRPAPTPHVYDFGSQEDKMVEDVLSDEFLQLWVETGRNNRVIFENIFKPVPDDSIHNWEQYKEYLKPHTGVSIGHVVNKDLSLREVKDQLSRIRGHLVDMPINFCQDLEWMTEGDWMTVNPYTKALYV